MKTVLFLAVFVILFITLTWSKQTSQPASDKKKRKCTIGSLTLEADEQIRLQNKTRCTCKRTNEKLVGKCFTLTAAEEVQEQKQITELNENLKNWMAKLTDKNEHSKTQIEKFKKRVKRIKAKLRSMTFDPK